MRSSSDRAWAIFFCRVVLGLIFAMDEFHTHVIPRLALLTVVLLLPRPEDTLSVEGFLRSKRSRT
jgi:hypothetical protein